MVAVGEVIRVWDRQTRPAKWKRMICVSADDQLFLRINSKGLFPPHTIISSGGADFLDHDSYVELRQLVRPYAAEIKEADSLGSLGQTHVRQLLIAVEHCKTLSAEHQRLIIGNLTVLLQNEK